MVNQSPHAGLPSPLLTASLLLFLRTHLHSQAKLAGEQEATSTSSQLTWFLPSTETIFGFMIFFFFTVHHTRTADEWQNYKFGEETKIKKKKKISLLE